MSRQQHRFIRTLLAAAAAALAFTVVITSKPAVTPAAASPDQLPAPRALKTTIERDWSQARTGLPDPRQGLLNYRR